MRRRDGRRRNDPTRAREAQAAEREAARQLAMPELEPAGRVRCRWNVFCPHPPVEGHFGGHFCVLHDLVAAFDAEIVDEPPEGAGWLEMSSDAAAIIDQHLEADLAP